MVRIIVLLISLMFLGSCSLFRQPHVGECFIDEDKERWQENEPKKVLEVGENRYLYTYFRNNPYNGKRYQVTMDGRIRFFRYTKTIECTQELKEAQ